MVICSSLSDIVPGRQPATGLPAAQRVQRLALAGQIGRALAHDAARLSALACRVSADSALAEGTLLRVPVPRSAHARARVFGTRARADRWRHRQPHDSIHTRIGRARGLRWRQEQGNCIKTRYE